MVRLALPVAEYSGFFLPTTYLLAELEWVLVSNPFRLYPLYLHFTALPHYPFKQMQEHQSQAVKNTGGTTSSSSPNAMWKDVILGLATKYAIKRLAACYNHYPYLRDHGFGHNPILSPIYHFQGYDAIYVIANCLTKMMAHLVPCKSTCRYITDHKTQFTVPSSRTCKKHRDRSTLFNSIPQERVESNHT